MAQTINPAFPVLSISAADVQTDWLATSCKSFFFCCSLEPSSESEDDFAFLLAGYSQDVEGDDDDRKLTFADLSPQPAKDSATPVNLTLDSLVMNGMYIRYDDLSAIVDVLTKQAELQQITFYPDTKQGDTKNNIAYALMFQVPSGYISYTDLSTYLQNQDITVIDINGRGAVQLNPCPPHSISGV